MARSKLSTLMAFDRQTFMDDLRERERATIDRALPLVPELPNISKMRRAAKKVNDPPAQIQLFSTSHSYIIGVDEVGRGCLAGPVVAGAVMLPLIESRSPLAKKLARLDDSKAIPEAIREELRAVICSCAHYSVAEASAAEIDEINILNASLLAMKRAVHELLVKLPVGAHEVLVLVDGNRNIKDFKPRQKTVIQGDGKSASIAAASVVAKVYRDNLMRDLSVHHPQYLWHQNKGYGSKAHRTAIVAHGSTVWHRQSFRLIAEEQLEDEQEGVELELALELELEEGLELETV